MKKITLLLIAVSIFGCSSSDDNENISKDSDPIIGTWKLSKEVYYNKDNNTSTERVPDNCENISSMEYKQNNTISFISYEGNGISNCTLQPNNWEYAKWQNLGNNSYKFTSKIAGQTEEILNNTVQFPNSAILILKGNSIGIHNGQTFDYSEEYYVKIQ